DLSWPPGVSLSQTGVRCLRACQRLPLLRPWSHSTAARRTPRAGSGNRALAGPCRAVKRVPATVTGKTRWTIAILAVVAALTAALVVQLRDSSSTTMTTRPAADREHRDADTAAALAGPRERADLPRCPAAGSGPGPAALRGVMAECA